MIVFCNLFELLPSLSGCLKSVKLPELLLAGYDIFLFPDDATVNVCDKPIYCFWPGDPCVRGKVCSNRHDKNVCDNPFTEALKLYNSIVINANENNEHVYLGM